MDLVELKVEIPVGEVEAVDTALLEHGVDAWSVMEDVIVKRAWLTGIFETRLAAREAWAVLGTLLAVEKWPAPEMRDLAADEWRNSYRAHFKAWKFGRLHWVPEWERESYIVPAGEEVLWLDPGLAFGTGNHETTRLCVDRLVEYERELAGQGANLAQVSVIDAGCGSGILALSALKLGFRPVEGFDNDPEAVRVSEENAALNGLGEGVTFFVGDLVTGLRDRSAGVVFANILADVLVRHARELVAAVKPGGRLILSGILATENEAVRKAYAEAAQGWPIAFNEMGEWSDVVLSRPKRGGQ